MNSVTHIKINQIFPVNYNFSVKNTIKSQVNWTSSEAIGFFHTCIIITTCGNET